LLPPDLCSGLWLGPDLCLRILHGPDLSVLFHGPLGRPSLELLEQSIGIG
jgi:hypothetical protein